MDKLKYDSLYKFIVSLGILIMILPIFFIMYILNNNELITIKESEIYELTDTAQQIIIKEQNYLYSILNHPKVCGIIISTVWIVGIVIMVIGLKRWNDNVQKNEDRERVLSNQILERQIEHLTPLEKNEKVREDIRESENIIDKGNISKQSYKAKISKYLEVQNSVYDKIKNIFNDYNVFEEVKIEKEQYDCIAVDVEEIQLDYIFEIKYYSDIKSIRSNLKSICLQVEKRQDSYRRNTKRYSRNVIIIITDEVNDKIRLENKKLFDSINEKVTVGQYMTKIIVTDVNELEVELKKFKEEILF